MIIFFELILKVSRTLTWSKPTYGPLQISEKTYYLVH